LILTISLFLASCDCYWKLFWILKNNK
jgi:hypothetical protein